MSAGNNYAELFYSNITNDIDTLEKNVNEYPFSSLARFLLLYHYKKNNNSVFEKLAKKTGIYINNPFWTHYQLSDIDAGQLTDGNKEEFEELAQLNQIKEENILPSREEIVTPNPVAENELSEEKNQEIYWEQENHNEKVGENTLPYHQEIVTPNPVAETEDFNSEKKEESAEIRNEEEEGKIISTASESERENGANGEEESLAFEPLHTIDYFASQGIKISEEVFENDHLGKQVKSFTAWLKSMKKLHPGQLPEQNEVIAKIIRTSAEASNQNVNVLTEAMAEVLIKQDKKEKAIEMYEKLSLINPSKSAYFAAKIESLKSV